MAFESFANPLLSLLTMLAEFGTFLDGCHSLISFLIETPHLRIQNKYAPLPKQANELLFVKGRDPAGPVMFTRATPGGGNSAGPSLESEGFLSLKFK